MDKLQGDCKIILVYKDGEGGFSVEGRKNDLKDLLYSYFIEDPVFASLAAVALYGYLTDNKKTAFEVMAKTMAQGQRITPGKVLQAFDFDRLEPKPEPVDEDKGLGKCMEAKGRCGKFATRDYNGHGYFVCERCYDRLSAEFDEEYR